MTQPPDDELDRLCSVADEIHEVDSDRGYHVDQAIDCDPAFSRGERPRSALIRSLVAESVESGGRAANFAVSKGPGGAVELTAFGEGVERIYRLRRAEKLGPGSYLVKTNQAANLMGEPSESFFEPERWIFGYTVSGGHPGEVFVARIIGVTLGTPGHLLLSAATVLRDAPTTSGHFIPEDEPLTHFGDSGDDELPGSA